MKKFLIVEDDKSMRSLYSLLLNRYFDKSTVNFSYNGNDALEEVLKTEYDLILSDINMEVMDGISFHQKLKEIDPVTADRIMFMSSSNTGPHIRYIKKEGLTFLQKPFKVSDFYAILASNPYLNKNSIKPDEGLGARRYARLGLNSNCVIETFFDNNFLTESKIEAESIDFSQGGMGIRYSGKKLITGEYVHVYLEEKSIEQKGARIVWASNIDKQTYRMGLKWV